MFVVAAQKSRYQLGRHPVRAIEHIPVGTASSHQPCTVSRINTVHRAGKNFRAEFRKEFRTVLRETAEKGQA